MLVTLEPNLAAVQYLDQPYQRKGKTIADALFHVYVLICSEAHHEFCRTVIVTLTDT